MAPGGGTLPANTILTNQYGSLGVTFSAFENGSLVNSALLDLDFVADNPPSNSGNFWANTTSNSFGSRRDIFRMEFADPVSDVAWYTESFGNPMITFQAYAANRILLETINSSGNFVLTSFTAGGISRIDALQPTDDRGWGLDNLSFQSNAAAVPEPSSLALFGIGACVAGVGAARRRRGEKKQEATA